MGKNTKKKISKIILYCCSMWRNYKLAKYENIDWVFIATPNNTHLKIINFLRKKK